MNSIFNGFAEGFEKKITKKILNSDKNFKKGLIRSFYDDEGTVGKKNIRLFQDRRDILESFWTMLLLFDIHPSEIKEYKKRGKMRYYFDIFKKSNFKRFRKNIGFSSSIKSKKLDEICVIKNFKSSR